MESTTTTVIEESAPVKSRLPFMVAAAIVLVLGGGIAALSYVLVENQRVYIDKAQVSAPQIALSPAQSGILTQILVAPGDTIGVGTPVAQVDTELITSTSAGLVVATDNNIGAQVTPQTAVVTMIDPTALRVVGQLDENKGLANVAVGDRAYFTVDAFGSTRFEGVVDEVSPTARAGDVVFTISDKRQTQSFNVKIAFDAARYPQLKNGMSARIWVYTR